MLVDQQDRSLWDRRLIEEGGVLIERALGTRAFGPYTLQAAIAVVHVKSPTAQTTDWQQIVILYDLLLRVNPSPVIELESRGGGGDARWTGTGAGADRCVARAWGAHRVLPGAFGAG